MAAFLLAGSLDEIALPDVARLLHATQKTGRLAVESGAMTGAIFFERGDIVDASAGTFSGLDAIRHLALFSQGTFEFVDGASLLNRNLASHATVEIIRLLENRVHESRQLQELMPEPRQVPQYLGGTIPAGFEVSAAELAVALRSSAGVQSAQQLADELQLDLLMVRYTVARFRAAGLMEISETALEIEPVTTGGGPVPVPGGHVDSTSSQPKYWRGRRIG